MKERIVSKGLAVAVILLFTISSFGVAGQNENPASVNPTVDCYILFIKNITGGIGVHAEIENGYHSDLENVDWHINIHGGGIILIGKERTGVIDVIPVGETVKIWSFVFGILGWGVYSRIWVYAGMDGHDVTCREARASIRGPFVYDVFMDPHMV